MNVMMPLFRDIFERPGGQMDPWMWSWGYHMGWFSIFMMGLFWIAVIVVILFLIRWLARSSSHRNREARSDSALEILRMRYAKGEINKEEFEQKKKDLGYE